MDTYQSTISDHRQSRWFVIVNRSKRLLLNRTSDHLKVVNVLNSLWCSIWACPCCEYGYIIPLKNSFLFQNMGANPLILLGVILAEQRFSTEWYTRITVQLEAFLSENFTKSLVILKPEALKNLKENIETAADILPSHRISCFVILTNLYHWSLKCLPGTVKLYESPGKAGGFPKWNNLMTKIKYRFW